MEEQIPSPDDTKKYTALAIQCVSGSFRGQNLSKCISDEPEHAYYRQVDSMVFDFSKVDFFQKEFLPIKDNPYTVLSGAITIQNFVDANTMLDVFLARRPTPKQLIEALDLHHSRAMLKTIHSPYAKFKPSKQKPGKKPYPMEEFFWQEGRRFVDRIEAYLPREVFITQVLQQNYSYEMKREDLEYERDKENQQFDTPATVPPQPSVRKIGERKVMHQLSFERVLFRED